MGNFPGNDGTNLVGRRVGRYDLLYEIASGGMAAVYLARARGASGFERMVAVKVPHPHLRKDEEFAPMFLDEARLAAKIHHPNVVPVLDFGDAGVLYLVMDYVEGNHLAALIRAAGRKGERIPPGITLRILIDALTGLHAAHELKDTSGEPLNIVHRDTSPQNVLIGTDGIGRITDFGIARAEARATITRDGQVKGKLSYIAPEQLAGEGVTRRADVFGMGVLLWESLVGQRLFRGDSEAETVNLLLSAEVRKPSEYVPELPASLDKIVLKALARRPDDRFATAAEFADQLESCGVKIATPRQVAAYVEEKFSESLARRRGEVKEILESKREFHSLRPGAMPDDASPTPMALDDGLVPPKRTNPVLMLAAGVVIVAAFAVSAIALHRPSGNDAPRAAATAPASTTNETNGTANAPSNSAHANDPAGSATAPPPTMRVPPTAGPTTEPTATGDAGTVATAPIAGTPQSAPVRRGTSTHSTVASPPSTRANSPHTRSGSGSTPPREFSPGSI